MAYSHPIIGPLYQTESWLYAMNMDAHPTLKRLLEAFIFTALAGGVGYAVTTWLAPDDVSAGVVAAIVAAIAGIASVAPNGLLHDKRDPDSDPWRPPEPRSLELLDDDAGDFNPATGLPMMGGMGGLDAGGNTNGSSED